MIWTDSQYLVDGYQAARFKWPANRWMTSDGNPVAHADQWKDLVKAADRIGLPVRVEWVKGHKSSPYNKQADKLAKASARAAIHGPQTPAKVRRKKSPHSAKRGSVEMKGQRLTIRIIEELAQPEQRMVRFKYEVMSKASPYHQRVDYIWDQEGSPLRAHHSYRVRVNDDVQRPRIVKVFGEVEQR